MAPIIEYPAQQWEAAPNSMVIFLLIDIVDCMSRKLEPIECVRFSILLNFNRFGYQKKLSRELAFIKRCLYRESVLTRKRVQPVSL